MNAEDGNVTATTPALAVAMSREIKRATGIPAVIEVADGTYELDAPLRLTPEDNETLWRAAENANPVFSGGRKLAGWHVTTHKGMTAWTLEIPEVRDGQRYFKQLWANGKRRKRPVLPKQGCYYFAGVCGHQPKESFGDGPLSLAFAKGEILEFHNRNDVDLVSYEYWFDSHLKIEAIDLDKSTIRLNRKPLGSMMGDDGRFARYRLYNAFEALDTPGEWYLDRTTGILTYLPCPGELPEQTEIVVPWLEEVALFQGEKEQAVSGIRIENIAFGYCEKAADPCMGQAASLAPGAIVFNHAENCVLYGCEIAHCSGYGLEMNPGCHGNIIAACTIHDLGAGGVKIGHESYQPHAKNLGEPVQQQTTKRMAATVIDCEIFDGGHINASAVGVWIGNSGENRVVFNHIHDFKYTGVSIGWTWGFQLLSRGFRNIVDNNHIHHINYEGLLSDNGGIYSLGLLPGSSISGNNVHHIGCYHYGASGIYLDEGTSGVRCENNCVHHTLHNGFNIHYARLNRIRNNLFVNTDCGGINFGLESRSFGNTFATNILYFTNSSAPVKWSVNPTTCGIRNCVIYNEDGAIEWPSGSLEKTQLEDGNWLNSLEADPRLRDPRQDEFSLLPDSPALKLGFKPLERHVAGVRSPGTRPLSFEQYPIPRSTDLDASVAWVQVAAMEKRDGKLFIDADAVVRNLTGRPLRGSYEVMLVESTRESREHRRERLDFELAGHEDFQKTLHVEVSLDQTDPSLRLLWLVLKGDEAQAFSGADAVLIPQPGRHIPRYADASVQVSEVLKVRNTAQSVDVLVGEAHLVNNDLVITGRVRDLKIRVAGQPWEGSCIEIFLAAKPGAPVKQLFMLPPHGKHLGRLAALYFAMPEDTRFTAESADDGWSFHLKLPLAGLGIDGGSFCLDLTCRTAPQHPGLVAVVSPTWGTSANYANSNYLLPLTAKDDHGR